MRSQIVGYGQTPFGRAADKTLADLGAEAGQAALDSAGIAADAVQAIFVGTYAGVALGRQGFLAAVVASRLGTGSVPVMRPRLHVRQARSRFTRLWPRSRPARMMSCWSSAPRR